MVVGKTLHGFESGGDTRVRRSNLGIVALIAAAAPPAMLAWWLAPSGTAMLTFAAAMIGVSLACGIFAYATHVRRDAPRLTAWDVAGVFMIIGCAAAMFSDPDQLFQTVGQIAME